MQRTPSVRVYGLRLSLTGLCATLTLLQASRTSGVNMAVSKPMTALPFLTAASCQSSGLPGADTGFDPLYLSDFLDIKWLREAELKHGRICMLYAPLALPATLLRFALGRRGGTSAAGQKECSSGCAQ